MTKKLDQSKEKQSFMLSVPQKPGYFDGVSYGRILIDKIDWMDDHFGLLPEGYDSIFEISEESVLKDIVQQYSKHKLFLMFDAQQNGIYTDALRRLRIYKEFEEETQKKDLIYKLYEAGTRKNLKKNLNVKNTEKSNLVNNKSREDYIREGKFVQAIRKRQEIEKRKRKNAIEVLKKVEQSRKILEIQTVEYQKNKLEYVKRKKQEVEEYLIRMNGRAITNDDVQNAKNAPFYLKYEKAKKAALEKEQNKRNRARDVLNEVKKQEKIRETEIKNYWNDKAENELLKRYSDCEFGSLEWNQAIGIKLLKSKKEFEETRDEQSNKVNLKEKFEVSKKQKEKSIKKDSAELKKLQKVRKLNPDENNKRTRRREKLRGRIKKNNEKVKQLEISIRGLSDDLEHLQYERLRTFYVYRATLYLYNNISFYGIMTYKRKIDQCNLFLSKSAGEQLEVCREILDERNKRKTLLAQKSTFCDMEVLSNDMLNEKSRQNEVDFDETNFCKEIECGINSVSEMIDDTTEIDRYEEKTEIKNAAKRLEKTIHLSAYQNWKDRTSELRKIEALLEIESSKMLSDHSAVVGLLDDLSRFAQEAQTKQFQFTTLRCKDGIEFYDYTDEVDFSRSIDEFKKGISWEDFLVFIDNFNI